MIEMPSFPEDHVSQIPALQLLQNIGYEYLHPAEVYRERKGRLSNVLLEGILEEQLKRINRIRFKAAEHEFSDKNIQAAIEHLRSIPFDGLISTNEKIFDLISLGKSLEQTIEGDTKSFTLNYIDWQRPESNVFHVTEEFEVESIGSREVRRPDIVLFVNGIPLVVIECKRPDLKHSLDQAISQHIQNQSSDHIPQLFIYSQLLLAVGKNEAAYATTGTQAKFWAKWRERDDISSSLTSLCRPERLLELTRKFILFDAGEKKIARYQQYFAVQNALERIKQYQDDGKRVGGVIWHAPGCGKSHTMVMLAKAIALEKEIIDPKIVLVTDSVELDDQIYRTFHHCGKDPVKARTGRHLLQLLSSNKEMIITTTIFKFESAIKTQKYRVESKNMFTLVDECHRTLHGDAHLKLHKVLPNACYIGFTGTPLTKKQQGTASQFGGFIDMYTIRQGVEDKSIAPLLYERRHVLQEVDQSAERKIYLTALDISEHFSRTWKGTGFKGQLTADSKLSALKFKDFFDEFGKVTSEVLISAPDTREGNDDTYRVGDEEVQGFWKRTLEKYGNEEEYNQQLINAFKNSDDPEIIIVVDKLLTGFDAPRNTVLYITRSLKEHQLSQATARVNRLSEGKNFGYIIDYYGVPRELGEAMDVYGSPEFDKEDLDLSITDISILVRTLPQKHSELWDLFKEMKDEEAYEQVLANDLVRQRFYDKLSAYNQALVMALSTVKFNLDTPEEEIDRYTKDLVFFQKLRMSARKRRTDDELPARLQAHEVAKALYGIINDVLSRKNGTVIKRNELAANAALRIDEIIGANRVVDWNSNLDVQNQIRNEIDDFLYEMKELNEIDLTLEDMDFITESALNIAKARHT